MRYYWRGKEVPRSRYVAQTPYYKQTKASYQARQEQIEEQREMFEQEKELEGALTTLRDEIDEYMSGRITLGQLLGDLMDSSNLCQRIGVWRD